MCFVLPEVESCTEFIFPFPRSCPSPATYCSPSPSLLLPYRCFSARGYANKTARIVAFLEPILSKGCRLKKAGTLKKKKKKSTKATSSPSSSAARIQSGCRLAEHGLCAAVSCTHDAQGKEPYRWFCALKKIRWHTQVCFTFMI